MSITLQCGRFELDLGRPLVMGILNVTPDSFSDGNGSVSLEDTLARARGMIADGADMLDIGGESTRPGADPVSEQEELERVIPVIEALRDSGIPLSVDTFKPEVMRRAIEAGADMINDIRALQAPGAIEAVAESNCGLCIMHMQGEPRTMQAQPHYDDVIGQVHRFLADRILACALAGIERDRLVIDPGFGFGKNLEHNLTLLAGLPRFADLDVPLLAGLSRKCMIGTLTGQDDPRQRVHGSIAAAVLAAQGGAAILRVHDVAATREALAVQHAVAEAGRRLPQWQDTRATSRPRWPDED